MIPQLFFALFLLFGLRSLHSTIISEQFQKRGYIEIENQNATENTFNELYTSFDELIAFLQTHPFWEDQLYKAKERFIRSPNKKYYCSDFFGFYDESKKEKRSQISFYYSTHFHEFICSHYPEFHQVPQIMHFFDLCFQIQQPYGALFKKVSQLLELPTLFSPCHNSPPLLFKVIKYLPSYIATTPHYDGTAFSLFLDSTDKLSLLLSPYHTLFTMDDFSSPFKKWPQEERSKTLLLIPGTLLTEFSIYPTPHIVLQNGTTRYATIAFAMRPFYTPPKKLFSPLPSFEG